MPDPLLLDTYASGYVVIATAVAKEIDDRIKSAFDGIEYVYAPPGLADGQRSGIDIARAVVEEFIKEINARSVDDRRSDPARQDQDRGESA